MIRHLEVDGVPTVLAPTSGPMHAGLTFRVGQADETLARSGITHLIEHLALHPLGITDYHYNGATGNVTTYFHLQGSPDEIGDFLTSVCDSLANLPMQRLAVEKEILRTEAAGRKGGVNKPLALWRYGASDYGLQGYPEWGLSAVTPEDLHAWVARYFTRDNAVLWIAGDAVPSGLSLRLPAGVRRQLPVPSSTLPVTPAYFPGSAPLVAWDTVVPRSTSALVFASVLEREMFRSLRQEAGLSYTAQADYDPRGDGTAVITAVADALPDKLDAVLGGFVDVLATLRFGQIRDTDIKAVVTKSLDALGAADAQAARLPGYAFNLLTGGPQHSTEQLAAELRAVTADDIARIAGTAIDGGLLMTPNGRSADWAGFTKAPTTSDTVTAGTSYRSLEDPAAAVIVGDLGVSLVRDKVRATVDYDSCAALLTWPDGGRVLIGTDAISVHLEPTLYAGIAGALPLVDAAVPADRRVDLPARDPDEIPRPNLAKARAARWKWAKLIVPVITTALRTRSLLVPAIVGLGAMFLVFTAQGDDRRTGIFGMIMCLALATPPLTRIIRATRRSHR